MQLYKRDDYDGGVELGYGTLKSHIGVVRSAL